MADELAGLIAQLGRRNVHLTRRQLLRALAATGLGVAGLDRLLAAPDAAAAYPTLRALLAAAPPAAAAAAVAGAPAGHGAPLRGDTLPAKERLREGRFGLLFKDAPPYAPPDHLLSALARQMAEAPPAAGDAADDNAGHPAGFTFFGQFVDHDLTLDRTPLAEAQADPDAVRNFRSARYDLDSVYGGGPAADPQLYDPADPAKLRVGAPGDLPRQPDGRAILVEVRNDENAILSQLHVAFLRFHNALVDLLRARGVAADRVFAEARQLARWHYQWAVLHDFLPRLAGPALLGDLVRARPDGRVTTHLRFFHPGNPTRPMLPVEFTAAAYRFGHSTIRPSYTINDTGPKDIFGASAADGNLNGGRPLTPARLVDWATLFPTDPTRPPQSSRRLDTRLALPLQHLPAPIVRAPDLVVSLAERNLLRGKRLGLPSGQEVARRMGVAPLANQQLGLSDDPSWGGEAPLWYYILKEAELQHDGARLGAVGGRIVGEVLVGLCANDPNSYLARRGDFRPLPPIAPAPGQFTLADLLRFAGATPPLAAPGVTHTLTVATGGAGTGRVTPETGPLPAGTVVTLAATAGTESLFTDWVVDGRLATYANPLDLAMRGDRTITATFGRVTPYPDVPATHPNHEAIRQLAAREIIRGFPDGSFQPGANTLRAQMAALIARAMGWEGEEHGNAFPDRGAVDAALWRNVNTLAHYRVARGFPDGTYKPVNDVAYAQTISFITRAMVARDYWQQQPDTNPGLYPNITVASGHRRDVVTYYRYAGAIPGTDPHALWATWSQPSMRAWFAEALWQALESHFGRAQVP